MIEKIYKKAVEYALKAGEIIRKNYEQDIRIEFKSRIDIVTEVDKKVEDMLVSLIHKDFEGHDIVTEETHIEKTGSEFIWYIDPLDGTTNYSHGFPFFCVSIGVFQNDEPIVGIVYDPIRDEFFESKKGGISMMNGKVISPSKIDTIERSLLSTGFPYDIRETDNNNVDYFTHMIYLAQAIRRGGSAALDLCYVACGRLDGYWELKLSPWDTAAGILILRNAGGVITDIRGETKSLLFKEIAATNGLIHDILLDELRKAGANK